MASTVEPYVLVFKQTNRLHRLGGASGAVVDLAAPLAALVGPGEVGDGNDEERVAGVGNTGKGVVPGGLVRRGTDRQEMLDV